MALTPFGLWPVNMGTAASWNSKVKAYFIPASDTGQYFVGDPVIRTGAVNAETVYGFHIGALPVVAAPQTTTAGTPPVTTITGRATGVIVGFLADQLNQDVTYSVGGKGRVALVIDDPLTEYEVLADEPIALGAIVGKNVSLNPGTPNTFVGMSGISINTESAATTITLPWTVLRASDRIGNDLLGNPGNPGATPPIPAADPGPTIFVVRLNQSTEANATAGV